MVPPGDAPLPHVHGFHAYPGRLHPDTAARLVAEAPPRGTVLDPFCGGGTVLVEAMLAGRAAIGVDVNPLAVRLATLRTSGGTGGAHAGLARLAAEVCERARGLGYVPAPSAAEARWFAPHVLRELSAIRAAITERRSEERKLLELVLSAILVKVSRQRSDSSLETCERRLAPGFATRLVVAKAGELEARLAELEQALPRPRSAVRVLRGDARELAGVEDASVDLVVTSPPYGGVYDYAAFQARRAAWLGLGEQLAQASAREIGRRGRAGRGFAHELGDVLVAIRRVLRRGHPAILVLGDGTEPAEVVLDRALGRSGLRVLASASQPRLRGEEHAFALV